MYLIRSFIGKLFFIVSGSSSAISASILYFLLASIYKIPSAIVSSPFNIMCIAIDAQSLALSISQKRSSMSAFSINENIAIYGRTPCLIISYLTSGAMLDTRSCLVNLNAINSGNFFRLFIIMNLCKSLQALKQSIWKSLAAKRLCIQPLMKLSSSLSLNESNASSGQNPFIINQCLQLLCHYNHIQHTDV